MSSQDDQRQEFLRKLADTPGFPRGGIKGALDEAEARGEVKYLMPERIWGRSDQKGFYSSEKKLPGGVPYIIETGSAAEIERLTARAEKAEAEVARLKAAQGAADAGQIWAEVRSALTLFRERFTEAFATESYEMQSAKLDGLAQDVTGRIERRLRALAGPDGGE